MVRLQRALHFAFLIIPLFLDGTISANDDDSEQVSGIDNDLMSSAPSFTEVPKKEVPTDGSPSSENAKPTAAPCVCVCLPPTPAPTPKPNTTNHTKCNSAPLHDIMTKHMSVASVADLQNQLSADISHEAAAAFGGGFMTICQNGGEFYINYQFFDYRCEVHHGEPGSGEYTCLSIRSYV